MRRDVAAHIRDLEPHLQGTEITQRWVLGFGLSCGLVLLVYEHLLRLLARGLRP